MTAAAPDGWTADELQRALWRHYGATGRCAVLVEVAAPDLERRRETIGALERSRRLSDLERIRLERHLPYSRRVDVLLWGLQGGSIALELKVTRADYLADVRDPDKQRVWRELAGRHAYCAPAGLIGRGELPADSGLLEVQRTSGGWACSWARTAPRLAGHRQPELPAQVLAALAYRTSHAEAWVRGHIGRDKRDAGELYADNVRLQRELDKARTHAEQARARAAHYQRLASRAEPEACWCCQRPLRVRWTARMGETWTHLEGAEADEACRKLRDAEKARRQARDRFAWVPGPAPHDPDAEDQELTA